MLGRILFACLLILSLSMCGQPAAPVPNVPDVLVGLDTQDLSPAQRRVVVEAENSWSRQTRGCVEFVEGHDVLVSRLTPPDRYDDPDSGYQVLGMTTYHHVELNFSRFTSLDVAIIVTAHELGHVLGMLHNTGRDSLMNAHMTDHTHLNLSPEDRIDLYKATGCR